MALAVPWVYRLPLIPLLTNLILPPLIPALAQRLGAADQDVFQRPCFGRRGSFYFAPFVEFQWAREDMRDPLNQELDPLGIPLPDVLPGDSSLHHLLLLNTSTRLPHGHCSAGSLFLD